MKSGMESVRDDPENPMLEQVVGRTQRYHPTKMEPMIEDVWIPTNVSTNRLAMSRQYYYQKQGYKIIHRRYEG